MRRAPHGLLLTHVKLCTLLACIVPAQASSIALPAPLLALSCKYPALIISLLVVLLLMIANNIVRSLLGIPTAKTTAYSIVSSSLSVAASRTLALTSSWIDALVLHADAHLSDIYAFSGAVAKGHANAVSVYCWCSGLLVSLAAIVPLCSETCGPVWCVVLPATALLACALGAREHAPSLPGSAPIALMQVVLLFLHAAALVPVSMVLLPFPALLIYSVAAWSSARRCSGLSASTRSVAAMILFGILPFVLASTGSSFFPEPEFPPLRVTAPRTTFDVPSRPARPAGVFVLPGARQRQLARCSDRELRPFAPRRPSQ